MLSMWITIVRYFDCSPDDGRYIYIYMFVYTVFHLRRDKHPSWRLPVNCLFSFPRMSPSDLGVFVMTCLKQSDFVLKRDEYSGEMLPLGIAQPSSSGYFWATSEFGCSQGEQQRQMGQTASRQQWAQLQAGRRRVDGVCKRTWSAYDMQRAVAPWSPNDGMSRPRSFCDALFETGLLLFLFFLVWYPHS